MPFPSLRLDKVSTFLHALEIPIQGLFRPFLDLRTVCQLGFKVPWIKICWVLKSEISVKQTKILNVYLKSHGKTCLKSNEKTCETKDSQENSKRRNIFLIQADALSVVAAWHPKVVSSAFAFRFRIAHLLFSSWWQIPLSCDVFILLYVLLEGHPLLKENNILLVQLVRILFWFLWIERSKNPLHVCN